MLLFSLAAFRRLAVLFAKWYGRGAIKRACSRWPSWRASSVVGAFYYLTISGVYFDGRRANQTMA